jgi:hypothetical protein
MRGFRHRARGINIALETIAMAAVFPNAMANYFQERQA